jgi:hypothetical protein
MSIVDDFMLWPTADDACAPGLGCPTNIKYNLENKHLIEELWPKVPYSLQLLTRKWPHFRKRKNSGIELGASPTQPDTGSNCS